VPPYAGIDGALGDEPPSPPSQPTITPDLNPPSTLNLQSSMFDVRCSKFDVRCSLPSSSFIGSAGRSASSAEPPAERPQPSAFPPAHSRPPFFSFRFILHPSTFILGHHPLAGRLALPSPSHPPPPPRPRTQPRRPLRPLRPQERQARSPDPLDPRHARGAGEDPVKN
jgi:hypothetical protein